MKRSLLLPLVVTALLSMGTASATLIDITNPTLFHFASFTNDPPAGALSRISEVDPATTYGDFGWHNSPSSVDGWPQYAGILTDQMYTVVGLRFQVHRNPFKDFILQGSNNSTTGLDGDWTDIMSNTVSQLPDLYWQVWTFPNTVPYSDYRISASNDYVGGWAMYRWDLLAEAPNVPEPSSLLLLGLTCLSFFAYRVKPKI